MNSKKRKKIVAALFAFFLAAVVVGCGANKHAQDLRPAKELYDSAMSDYFEDKFDDSERTFKTLMENYPLSAYAVDAQLIIGDVCFAADKYDEAASYYTNFVAMHPAHPRASYALFQKGMSYFKDILTIDRDLVSTRKSLFAFEDLIVGYGNSSYIDKSKEFRDFLRKRLAEREMYVARFYYKSKNYKAALQRFREVLKNYNDSGFSDETLYYVGESYARLGEDALAKDAFSSLVNNFPESPFAVKAKAKADAS
ncbi:outer membrane protein assembly factor BamD [bacterium]|nr:MAG: outer membrane protein assembly factor BamD [bacterium]